MENTLENKQKFFALYWGQKYCFNCGTKWIINERAFPLTQEEYIKLKPLSKIRDEDALEVAKLAYYFFDSNFSKNPFTRRKLGIEIRSEDGIKINIRFDSVIYIDSEINITAKNQSQIFDFIRSRGYALPYLDLSVEDQVKYGWVKLK